MRAALRLGGIAVALAMGLAGAAHAETAQTVDAVDAGFVRLDELHQAPKVAAEIADPTDAASAAGQRVIERLTRVVEQQRDTRYQARTAVNAAAGKYHWDCSGMMNWLLAKTAPGARRALASTRPVARDYARVIAKAPTHKARRGWQRIVHPQDLRPGDVFAFRRAAISTTPVTGHVGIIVGRAVEVPGWPNHWAVRIADSTRVLHGNDTRADDGIGGTGLGTMVFAFDDDGAPVGYGWQGTDSRWIIKTTVVFGRVSK